MFWINSKFNSIQIERALVKWKTGTGMFWINSKFDNIAKRVCTRKVENRYRGVLDKFQV